MFINNDGGYKLNLYQTPFRHFQKSKPKKRATRISPESAFLFLIQSELISLRRHDPDQFLRVAAKPPLSPEAPRSSIKFTRTIILTAHGFVKPQGGLLLPSAKRRGYSSHMVFEGRAA